MDCFYHGDAGAVGICKNCHRGLCAACAADVGNGLACRGACEAEVEILNAVLERSKRIHRQSGEAMKMGFLFFAFIGTLFLATAYALRNMPPMLYLTGGAGLLFLMLAAFQLATMKRLGKP